MSKIAIALVFVSAVSVFFFLAQQGVTEINPGVTFFNYNGSSLSRFDTGSYTLEENPGGRLPSSTASVSATTGNIFTDTFSTVKNWLLDTTGVGYIIDIVSVIPNFLKSIGIPAPISYSLGALWYGFAIFLIVAFIKGTDI